MTTLIGRSSQGRNMPTWLSGLRTQIRVVHALMIREAMSMHGHHGLGFFWIIGEPLFLMGGITFLWSIAHITHGEGVDVVPFALTGYSFITLWRHIAGRSSKVMSRSINLRYHKQIKMLDVLIARAILETIALFTAFTVSYLPLVLLNLCPVPTDPLLIVAGFFFGGIFSFGVGLILSSISEISDVVSNILPAVMYISLPATGTFTMQEWLPENTRYFLSWSPLVNCIEMIRGGVFSGDVTTYFSVGYTAVSCAIAVSLGLIMMRSVEKILEE